MLKRTSFTHTKSILQGLLLRLQVTSLRLWQASTSLLLQSWRMLVSNPKPTPSFAALTSLEDNPFAKRSEFDKRSLLAYKILTIISWLLVVVTAIYYTFNSPTDCHHNHRCHTIWGQNRRLSTPFSLNVIVTSVYWIILLIMQGGYIWHLYSANEHFVTSAANVGSHFIFVSPFLT